MVYETAAFGGLMSLLVFFFKFILDPFSDFYGDLTLARNLYLMPNNPDRPGLVKGFTKNFSINS